MKARVTELQEDAAKAAGATLEKVLSTFVNVLDTDAEAKPGDRIRAAELIGKHLGMFKDELEVTVREGLPTQLESARRRAQERHTVN